MTLNADVKARIPASRLYELTNTGTGQASSVNDTVLNAVIADVKQEFQNYSGIVYDETNPLHTRYGVSGVVCLLTEYKGVSDEASKLRFEWYALLDKFALTAGRKWVSPGSNVPYTPSKESAGMQPDADRTRFTDSVPLPPKQWSIGRRDVNNS